MNLLRLWIVLSIALICVAGHDARAATFEIGEKDFLLDGQPFVIRSGDALSTDAARVLGAPVANGQSNGLERRAQGSVLAW